MLYEIKISGASKHDGSISLDRMWRLAKHLSDIARGALLIRLEGLSKTKGRTNQRLLDAVEIRLKNLRSGSTVLELECDPFRETLAGWQGDVFQMSGFEQLPDQTPMSLIIGAFRDALQEASPEEAFLDKPLLRDLRQFQQVFLSKEETISFANQGSVPALELTAPELDKIKLLEEQTPEPQTVLVHGRVETLTYSSAKVIIQSRDGNIQAQLSEAVSHQKMRTYWGEEVSIVGTAHYKPSGRMAFLEIEKIFEPAESDDYFSRLPDTETVDQQIQRQLKEKGYRNQLAEIVGQWPGDEEFERLIEQLDE
jgi:hypothetical protein